jgi:uncharacterized protein
MLSADLVRARRRGDKLLLQSLSAADRSEAQLIAEALLQALQGSVGESSEDVAEVLSALERDSRHEKMWAGLKKLVLDRCSFGIPLELDPAQLRKKVFELASERRRTLAPGEFTREAILEEVAGELAVSSQAIEDGLFGDLKGAQRLTAAPPDSAESIVDAYEIAQIQGILLKAVRLTVVIHDARADVLRNLFQKLKFRQLLYRLEKLEGGVRIEMEGPFSLFESVTKYGLQLAMIVPALLECDHVELSADLRWGKERRPLQFVTQWNKAILTTNDGEPPLRSDVAALLHSLEKKSGGWEVSLSSELLEIPGVGLCIPDLQFLAPGRKPVFLEVLGFWSREAVWKRVEWAESGKHERVVFAVSSRLRVSEEVLSEETGAALYVYKGTMSAASVLAHVEQLSAK